MDTHSDIWLCQLSACFSQEQLFFPTLSQEEKIRAERFKFALHRSRFIASHGFTRSILARYLKAYKVDISYKKGEYGKPYLADIEHHNVHFNLSHTHDLALLAITQGVEVGVDIEFNERKTDWKNIVKRFFSISEQKALFLLPESEQRNAFFQLWTRKEAYMKVLGTGLALAPTQFSLTVPPEKPALIEHHSSQYPALEHVSFNTINMPETLNHYYASLAVASQTATHRLHLFSG